MRTDSTVRTLLFLIFVHITVLVPGIPTAVRAAATIAYIVLAGWLFVAIFGLGETRPLDRLLYGIGTSITALMLLGLAANMLLPFLGVSEPLQAATALVILDILALSGIIFLIRQTPQTPAQPASKNRAPLTIWSIPAWVLGVIPIILAAIGAASLNSGGGPGTTMLAIVVAVLLLAIPIIFRKQTNDITASWFVFSAGITLLFIGWLRSTFVSGVDINVEYHLFERTYEAGLWTLEVYRDSYNACMSITILPTLLAMLTGLGPTSIFKVLMPSLFALVPVATYVFLRRYVSTPLSVAGAAFVIAQNAFLLWWTIPIKQQVGMLLFSIIILLISDRDLSYRTRFMSVLSIGLGLVVAHYTTTYVTLALLLTTAGLAYGYKKLLATQRGASILQKLQLAVHPTSRSKPAATIPIPVVAVLILCAATIAWYGIITETEGSTVASVQQITTNLKSVFDDDVRQAGTLTSVFNPLGEQPNEAELLADVAEELNALERRPGRYAESEYESFTIENVKDVVTPQKVPNIVKQGAFAANELAKTLVKLFLVLGIGILLLVHLKRGDIELEIVLLVLVSFGVLAAILFLPFASIVYSVSRAYQQVAVIAALAFAIGVSAILSVMERYKAGAIATAGIATLVIIPILFYTGLVPLLVGGTSPATMLANEGRNYDEVYVDRGEVLAAEWVFANSAQSGIYAASRARHKLWLSSDFILERTDEGVFPQIMPVDGYIYADSVNTIRGVGFVASAGTTLAYRYPLEFLEEQKDIVYSTRTATVYR